MPQHSVAVVESRAVLLSVLPLLFPALRVLVRVQLPLQRLHAGFKGVRVNVKSPWSACTASL